MRIRWMITSLALILALSACRPATATPLLTAAAPTPQEQAQPAPTSTLRLPTPTASPAPSQTPNPTPTEPPPSSPAPPALPTSAGPPRQSQAIIVDHTSVTLFEQIPDEYLQKARELRMVYVDASVGQNINQALDCLTAANWAASSSACRRDYVDQNWNWKTFNRADFAAGRVPARILFDPDPIRYDRSNWAFEPFAGGWTEIAREFILSIAPSHIDSEDVLSFQFNYLHVAENSDIADPNRGFFVDQPDRIDYKDLEEFIAQHPDKIFFYWTTSLSRNTGSQVALDFNNQMRQYVLENDLILFDVADIESHTDQGVPCYDNRDGVEYCSRRADGSTVKCENEPDDGLQLPAICQDYTSEADGGHLGSISTGGLRLAKALWVLMARIAGWQP
jgi:hypothetical protein